MLQIPLLFLERAQIRGYKHPWNIMIPSSTQVKISIVV